ncbi:Fc.00g115160.m01.CDS01 [Cosmosporella sp. VM-42]
MAPSGSHSASTVLPRVEADTSPSGHTKSDLPPTPSSVIAGDSVKVNINSPAGDDNLLRFSKGICRDEFSQIYKSQSCFVNYHVGSQESSPPLTVASAIISRSHDLSDRTLLDEPVSYWKRYLISVLPTQTQCDLLVSYFFENINWIYQAIHAPSFRSEYAKFWATDVADIDLIWVALLYMILCLGGIFIPSQMAEAGGFEASELPLLYQRWYSACRQALHAGGHDSKPTLTQIQVFLISQLYWYSTKNVEVLNSHMGQAVRNAQALGLDREAPPSITNCLEREMRHRIWWDLVSSDTFQSLCLGRQPLLQSYLSTVPFPSNCNDVDITSSSIQTRPMSEPTEMSVHYFRARIFKVLNKLYVNNGSNLTSYSFITQIDDEIDEIFDEFPWYLQDDPGNVRQMLSPSFVNVITWMRHILQSCICIQRVRMYRPFLNPVVGNAWERCVAASTSALAIYKSLRSPNIARFQRSQKMHVQAYQVFSAAVALATFLLVEMPSNANIIRSDIELVIEDLHSHSKSVDEARWIPLIADGRRVIRRILGLYDARCKRALRSSPTQDGRAGSAPTVQPDDAPTALVPAIFSVFGGESTAHRYLERCAIEYIVNDPTSVEGSAATNGISTTIMEMSAWDALIDPNQWGQWGDILWADLDSVLAQQEAEVL